MGPRPELVYTHALLLELKTHPLAMRWPAYLDPLYKNSRGVWDPDRWHHEQKRSETPQDEEGKKSRPTSSLGEGVTKGIEDSIILSPQRGSFLSGCQAANKDKELSLRPDQGGRRVGSGRILRQTEKAEPSEYPSARGNRGGRTEREWERGGGGGGANEASKYGFRRGAEEENNGQQKQQPPPARRGVVGGGWDDGGDRRRGVRGGQSAPRRTSIRHENMPEWMDESVSLTDIIELKGFDEGKSGQQQRNSRPNSRQSNKSDRSGATKLPLGGGAARGGGNPPHQQQQQQTQDGFNFDQIMESVNLNSLLGGSVGCSVDAPTAAESKQTSRFSQFFQAPPKEQQQQQPPAEQGGKSRSRRSSIQEELQGNQLLRELNGEPVIKIPSPEESNKYFTPISPAAKTNQGENVLLDILQKGGSGGQMKSDRTVKKLEEGIRRSLGLDHQQQQQQVQQLHELEQQQRLEQLHHQQQQQQQLAATAVQQPKQDNDLSAFKKLVSQVQNNSENRPSLPLYPPIVVRPTPLGGLPLNAPTEQDILEGNRGGSRMGAARLPMIPPQLMQFLEHYQLNPEVLKRQETEHLMNNVNNGNFPLDNLVAQLSNPKLHPQQRDLVLTVLKLKTLQQQQPPPPPPSFQQPPANSLQALFAAAPPTTMRASPSEQHLSQPGAGGPPRVSPLMFSGGYNPHLSVSPQPQNQRVPSPQEMTVLTQQILQQALIKKKLEEQKENYRKKQESKTEKDENKEGRGGGKSGEAAGSPLLAFTPTSVMRKSAAERKDSDPSPKVPELKVTGMQEEGGIMEKLMQIQQQAAAQQQQQQHSPGRPILKGPANNFDERPGSLDLGGRSTRNNVGRAAAIPPQLAGLPGGHGLVGVPPGNNPLFFLNQLQAAAGAPQQMMGGGGLNQFGGPAGHHRLPHHHHHHQPPPQQQPPLLQQQQQQAGGMMPNNTSLMGRMQPGGGPTSPRAAVSPTPLSRFFPSEVLAAAAAGGVRHPPQMPPLPTGQALTLEEIERHAAAAAVKI